MAGDRPSGPAPVIGVAGPIDVHALAAHLDTSPSRLPTGLGGVPVTLLVQELLARGHHVRVATLSPDVGPGRAGALLEGPRLRISVGRYRRHGRARDAFRAERHAVRDALRREAPDVVHAHWSYEFALGALASGRPTLVTLHDWAPTILGFHRDGYRAVRLAMHVATLARGRRFTAVSPYIEQAARRWRRDVHVVPNGLPDVCFDAGDRVPSSHAPVLVSVNTGFGERKNTTTLLRAFARLRADLPTCRLVLVGEGHEPGGAAERWARVRDLADGVTFGGPRPYDQLLTTLGAADVLVHPSLEESFGMTLVEAMARGTPVVAGRDSGAVPWVLDHGRAGELTDVSSPSELAAAVHRVVTDPRRWTELSRRGHDHAWSTYRLSRVVDRYVELYDLDREVAR